MRILMVLLLMGVLKLSLTAQLIYFSCIDDTSTGRWSDIFELNLTDCSFNQICSKEIYGDFSIRPITNEWVLIEIRLQLGWYNMNKCKRLNWGGTILPSYSKFTYHQESDKYGYIWCIGESGIIKVNPPSLFYEFKGPVDFPRFSFGRSTFLDGKFYVHSVESSNPFQSLIIEIDTLNTLSTRVVSVIPSNNITDLLFAVHNSCGDNKLIASNGHEFYEVNIRTGVLTFLCRMNFPSNYFRTKEGSSTWNYDPRDCDVFIDLDINNSSGDMKNGFINRYVCRDDLPWLSDSDLDVFSDYGTMDSIVIKLLNPLDGQAEEILFQNGFNINGSVFLNGVVLTPLSNATNDSFELAVKSLRYKNTSCIITEGTRFIEFVTYKNGITDTAYCRLIAEGPFYFAGFNAQISICENDAPVSLSKLLGHCHTSGGTWLPSLSNYGMFDPGLDAPMDYFYIVGDSVCGYDTAVINIQMFDIPLFQFPNDTSLCFGDSLVLSVIKNGENFLWSDGSTGDQLVVKNEGLYWLELINANQCAFRDSIFVFFNQPNEIKKDVYICSNQTLNYNGKFYKAGDIILDTLNSLTKCDTLLELHVVGIPVPAPNLIADTLLCKDAMTIIRTDKFYSSYQWSTLDMNSTILAGPGFYQLTVTDQNNCSNSVSIWIKEIPEINYLAEATDPLCAEDKGRINMSISSGGIPPFRYFLNGAESSNGRFNNLNPGQYISQILDAKGCSVSDTFVILPGSSIDVQIPDKIELEAGSSELLKFIVSGGILSGISFQPDINILREGSDGLRIIASEDMVYEVKFEDINGCIITRKIQINVKRDEGLYIPNAFTPNGDQINDIWEPYIGTEYRLIQASIYNRWGERVYHSTTSSKWDGRCHDAPCLPGVYIYILELKDSKNKIKISKGSLTLIR
jgi:gliding motility-associated-like protein